MTSILIQNGRVIDPASGVDRVMNVLLRDGLVAELDASGSADTVIDAAGLIVAPGLIDIHVQLREPGREEDETIETGTAAAIAGGFTSIACLPNTEPPIDSPASVEFVNQKAMRAGRCNVFPLGCVSKGRQGKELAEIGALVEAGAVGFTDAPRSLDNAELLHRALQYCSMFHAPILNHPEMLDLSHDGVMHEGLTSMVLGLTGIPAEAEDVMTARDMRLAESTGGRLHMLSVSTSGSVDLVRRAKARGVRVTAGVCAANFTLTDETLRTFDPNYKTNPPLRSRDHVEAVIAGLKDGAIDVICSGHAPRAPEKKMVEILDAPFGVIGLQTTLPLVIRELIDPGHLDWPTALAKLTINPARVLRLDRGTLEPGAIADVTLIDPNARWTYEVSMIQSKSANSPYIGQQMHGRAACVIVGGEVKLRV